MTPTERQQKTAEDVASIKAMIADMRSDMDELKACIRGNGQPGIASRLTIVEANQVQCPAREAYKLSSRNQYAALVVSVISAVAAISAVIVAIASGVPTIL